MRVRPTALWVSATDGGHKVETVEDPRVVGPIDFAWSLGDKGREHTTFGVGPVAGTFVPGSNRLVVTGWSPLWDGFYPSTIGGAGLPWDGLGVTFMVLSGRAASPSVIVVEKKAGALGVRLEPIDLEAIWRGDGEEIGLYALLAAVHRKHAAGLRSARVLCVGPAAARTRSGAIGSAPIRDGELTSVDTWAGRGGLGTRLLRKHNIAALVYGGDFDATRDQTTKKTVDELFQSRFGRSLRVVEQEATAKYRFDPHFKTGGTFGANFQTLRERVLSFNYRSVEMDDETRTGIHERLIAGHYLRQFNEEIVVPKKQFTCGEPCGAVCKKVDGKFKKDYEPYQAMGPLVGVFDQRAAEQLNRHADAMGFDAIQIGGEVAWVMEGLLEGWLGEEETGIAERPHWSPGGFDPVADSAHNAGIARRIVDWIVGDPRASRLRDGLRSASRSIGGAAAEAAVYSANGDEHGCMVPNQYWVPGVVAPVPVMGRYYLNYQYEWLPPHELGRTCAQRMIKELMLDNYGMCRFHRGWAEEMLPSLVHSIRGIDVDADAHHRALASAMTEGSGVRPWATGRVVDMVRTYLIKVREDGPREPELDAWVDRFGREGRAAADAYWTEIREGFADGLKAA